MLSARTLDRLEATLRTLVGLSCDGIISATQKFIGARRGKSDRALRDDLRDLEALGLVETVQNYDKTNLRVRNTYRLHPMVFLWRKGKQCAEAARRAIVAITEGLTSRMVRRMTSLHNAYREAACANLKRGAESIERKIPAELTSLSSKEDEKHIKQPPAEATTSRTAKVLELVRLFGINQAARMMKLTPEKIKSVVEANNKGH